MRLASRVDRVAPLIEAAYRPPPVSAPMPDHLQDLADAMHAAPEGVRRWHAVEDFYAALLEHQGDTVRHRGLAAFIAGRDARARTMPTRPPDANASPEPDEPAVKATSSHDASIGAAVRRPPQSLIDALARLQR